MTRGLAIMSTSSVLSVDVITRVRVVLCLTVRSILSIMLKVMSRSPTDIPVAPCTPPDSHDHGDWSRVLLWRAVNTRRWCTDNRDCMISPEVGRTTVVIVPVKGLLRGFNSQGLEARNAK